MLPKLPTFRSTLMRMHKDLLRIDDIARWVDDKSNLNSFETMVIILEDRRFFDHFGFDIKALCREFTRIISFKNHGGASTIDMQLFRTISGRYERSYRRKLRESFGSIFIQFRLSKISIIRTYLEVAYFGTGLSGCRSAACKLFPHHFNDEYFIDMSKLSLREAAYLAALLVYPKPRFPGVNWHTKVSRRADYALGLYARFEKKLNEYPIG